MLTNYFCMVIVCFCLDLLKRSLFETFKLDVKSHPIYYNSFSNQHNFNYKWCDYLHRHQHNLSCSFTFIGFFSFTKTLYPSVLSLHSIFLFCIPFFNFLFLPTYFVFNFFFLLFLSSVYSSNASFSFVKQIA